MAYNNNDKNQDYDPTVNSYYGFINQESSVDKTALSIKFWNRYLVITISPLLITNGSTKVDKDNALSIYLYHAKSRILAEELKQFLANPKEFKSRGVDSGDCLISISNGEEFGVTSPCLVLRKIDRDTGNVITSYAYQFKDETYYSIRNFDENNKSFDKCYYKDLEIEQLITVLEQHYIALTNATAYSVASTGKYDASRNKTKMNLIMEKLGIEQQSSSNNYRKSSGSIFSNTSGNNTTSSYTQATVDDIDNAF